jgi:hypothetical protein
VGPRRSILDKRGNCSLCATSRLIHEPILVSAMHEGEEEKSVSPCLGMLSALGGAGELRHKVYWRGGHEAAIRSEKMQADRLPKGSQNVLALFNTAPFLTYTPNGKESMTMGDSYTAYRVPYHSTLHLFHHSSVRPLNTRAL